MFGSRIRDKDGVAATVSLSCDQAVAQVLTLFPARVHGNGRFAAPIWADSARVFRRALPDIRILPGEIRCSNNQSEP